MWIKDDNKKNVCFLLSISLSYPFPQKPQFEHICRDRHRAYTFISSGSCKWFSLQTAPSKAFELYVCFSKSLQWEKQHSNPFPHWQRLFPPAALPMLALVVKTPWDYSKEILVGADIYQVTARSTQVFDTQVFACNYQVVLQVAGAQHISKGYDEAAPLLV